MDLKKQQGFTLMEMVIGMALCGAVALITASVLKLFTAGQKKVGMGMSLITIEKLFEQHIHSRNGCQGLVGNQIDSEFGIRVGSFDFVSGAEIGEFTVDSLKLDDFSATDKTLTRGLTKVTLILKKDEKLYKKVVPVAVNIAKENRVESCLVSEQLLQEEIIRKVCSDKWGAVSKDLDCEKAALAVKEYLVEDICKDLNRGKGDAAMNGLCNLKVLHKEKSCEEGSVATGFDYDGTLLCNNAKLSPPLNKCKDWSAWTPDDNDVCEGEDFEQTRTCEDGEIIGTEKRMQSGAQLCTVGCSIWYRARTDSAESKSNLDGGWSMFKSNDVGDCNNPPLCGIMMGLSCDGNVKVRLTYKYVSADQESFEVISPWSTGDGTLVWGGWASAFTPDTNECSGTKKCGLQVNAATSNKNWGCRVIYQYKNDLDSSPQAMDGDWAVISNSNSKEANCDEGNGCGIRATIECKKK